MIWLAVFVAGSIGGAMCDQIHVQSGVLAYKHPWLADQAWWVAPQFGAGLLAVFAAAGTVARDRDRPPPRGIALDAVWFLAAYGASGWWHHHAAALAIGYGVSWVLRMLFRPDRARVIPFSALLAVGGVLYEGTLAGTGAFHYAHPDVYHVPVWLAGIYLHGGPLAISVARQVGNAAIPVLRPPLSRPGRGLRA